MSIVGKRSVMTQESVDGFCRTFNIPNSVHPTAAGRDASILDFPEGKVGVYSRIFDYCGYRIPFTKFFIAVLKYFSIHISQLSPFGAARILHFEVLSRVLKRPLSVNVFRVFYTYVFKDGVFSFTKRSSTAPVCLTKAPDSIKNWADHFFWLDARAFPISVPLHREGDLEKDNFPKLNDTQKRTVQILGDNKAPFRHYPECFLSLVGISPYYPFDEYSYPAFERPDTTGGFIFLPLNVSTHVMSADSLFFFCRNGSS